VDGSRRLRRRAVHSEIRNPQSDYAVPKPRAAMESGYS